jgi:hypothetical protein
MDAGKGQRRCWWCCERIQRTWNQINNQTTKNRKIIEFVNKKGWIISLCPAEFEENSKISPIGFFILLCKFLGRKKEILWIWIMNDGKEIQYEAYPGGFCFPLLNENIKLREFCLPSPSSWHVNSSAKKFSHTKSRDLWKNYNEFYSWKLD